MIAQKHHIRVTLDIIAYDDLDIDDINWRDILDLQGDEEVHSSIREFDPFE